MHTLNILSATLTLTTWSLVNGLVQKFLPKKNILFDNVSLIGWPHTLTGNKQTKNWKKTEKKVSCRAD